MPDTEKQFEQDIETFPPVRFRQIKQATDKMNDKE